MILLVDLEHDRLRSNPTLWQFFSAKTRETQRRIEVLSREHCTIARYHEVNPSVLDALNPTAVVVGGNYTGFQHFLEEDLAGLKRTLLEAARPTLAICGGFQLLVRVYGGQLGLMDAGGGGDKVAADGDTPYPPELRPPKPETTPCVEAAERGYLSVRVIQPHPLFEGLGKKVVVYQLHGSEVKRMPPGFLRLAESDLCRVQAVAHERRPLFGVQFHPERHDENRGDGRRILQNFFHFAGRPRAASP